MTDKRVDLAGPGIGDYKKSHRICPMITKPFFLRWIE